jgi:hypothetical protein
MVQRRRKAEQITFRNLPVGAIYYLLSGGTGPFVKIGRRIILNTNTAPNTAAWTPTTVSDTSVRTIKVTKFALGSQRSV